MWFGSISPCKKIKCPHPGAQTLGQIGGEGNRSEMPNICLPPPQGLTLIEPNAWLFPQ